MLHSKNFRSAIKIYTEIINSKIKYHGIEELKIESYARRGYAYYKTGRKKEGISDIQTHNELKKKRPRK